MDIAAEPNLTCSACGLAVVAKPAKGGGVKMPKGRGQWKRVGDCAYCPDCFKKLYRLRAVTFPVHGGLVEGGTTNELWAALRVAWDQCRMLVNWATTEIAKQDRPRRPGESLEGKAFKKEAPAPHPYLYPQARALFPDLPSQAVTALLKAAADKYAARRYEIVWRFDSSLPTCRREPLCLSNQAWGAEWREVEEDDGKGGVRRAKVPVVDFPLAGRRWTVRLRGRDGAGPFQRQTAAFAEIVSGAAVKGELVLYWQRSSAGAHRSTRPAKENGGGNGVRIRLMAKLVAYLPRHERRQVRGGTLEVRTTRNCLFVASHPDHEEPWLLHADWLRGLVFVHRQRLQRVADDTKAERRRPRRRQVGMQDHLDKMTWRYRCRLKSGIEYVGEQLIGYAARTEIGTVRLDDRDRRYCPELAWAQLRDALARQADNAGVALEFASDDAVETTQEPEDGPSD